MTTVQREFMAAVLNKISSVGVKTDRHAKTPAICS